MNVNERKQLEIEQILNILMHSKVPLTRGLILSRLDNSMHPKTLQRRLKALVDDQLIEVCGERRNTQYTIKLVSDSDLIETAIETKKNDKDRNNLIFSKNSLSLLVYLDTPAYGRKKVTYQAKLLQAYTPNVTQYVPDVMRTIMQKAGIRFDKTLVAGTYAKHIGQRLLIDLSYNSSRLEGNTYSKLDTEELINHGLSAEGKIHTETVMIMNHKEAILFLVENAQELILSPFIIRNIHYLLSQDLLKNPNACGKVRQVEVSIGKSAYFPLNNPHQLEEYLSLLLRKAQQIENPFEQSFFLLIHISYLQSFEDVNKRTARLACNIPFIRENLCPLSFIDVPQKDYFAALLYFYEKNDMTPALELFQWAYLQSCEQYDVVKASLGEIDQYRIQYRTARKEAMGEIIRQHITGQNIEPFLTRYCELNSIDEQDKFITMTTHDLENIHVGAIVGLGITESLFEEWLLRSDRRMK